MPPYALAIFDFDGTLADSWQVVAQVIVEGAGRFGYRRVSAEEAQRLRGVDNRAVMQALGVPIWQLPRIATHMRSVAASRAHEIALFPGVPDMLRAMAGAGMRVAIVSSNVEDTIRRVLGADLAAGVADFECGAAIFGKAARFRRVVRRAGVPSSQAIAIGDEARDIEAATAAGIAAGAVTWGYATPELLESRVPAHVFRSVDELTRTLIGT
jgi:phosphoglycolate phosphatase